MASQLNAYSLRANQIAGSSIVPVLTLSARPTDSTASQLKTTNPYYYGRLAAVTTTASNYIPNLSTVFASNVTVNANNIQIFNLYAKTRYLIHCQQLVSTSGGCYLHIRKQDTSGAFTTLAYAYSDNDITYNMSVTCLANVGNGERISFFYGGTTTYSWSAQHSSVIIYQIF